MKKLMSDAQLDRPFQKKRFFSRLEMNKMRKNLQCWGIQIFQTNFEQGGGYPSWSTTFIGRHGINIWIFSWGNWMSVKTVLETFFHESGMPKGWWNLVFQNWSIHFDSCYDLSNQEFKKKALQCPVIFYQAPNKYFLLRKIKNPSWKQNCGTGHAQMPMGWGHQNKKNEQFIVSE